MYFLHNLFLFIVTGSQYEEMVSAITNMGYERDQVRREKCFLTKLCILWQSVWL